jgi:sensor domain CHASE-containing protein
MFIFELIFFVVVVVGVITIDHRLHTSEDSTRDSQRTSLANATRTEIVKALQWIADKLAVMK